MALAKIDEVFVYTSMEDDPLSTHQVNAWFDHSGIEHIKINYPKEGIPSALTPLNTWWQADENGVVQPPATGFPLVVYTEIHSGKPVSYLPRKYIQGKDEIMATLPALYALGR
jgi:hypothetical protein